MLSLILFIFVGLVSIALMLCGVVFCNVHQLLKGEFFCIIGFSMFFTNLLGIMLWAIGRVVEVCG